MFRLSKIADYGIVLLVQMVGGNDAAPKNARALAEQVELPLPVVSKVLKGLARGGVLESQRGAKGGYSLSRPAHEISVGDMIEALEGPVALTECAEATGACIHETHCPVRDPWQVINHVVQDALHQVSLADLAQPTFQNTRPLDRFMRLGSELQERETKDFTRQSTEGSRRP